MALSVVRARLAYTDRSLVSRLLASAGGQGRPTPDVVADALAGLVTNPARTPWLDPGSRAALADFVRRPGRLEIEIAPTEPAPVLDALGIAATEPAGTRRAARPADTGDAAAVLSLVRGLGWSAESSRRPARPLSRVGSPAARPRGPGRSGSRATGRSPNAS
jgi:hypothetical protein